jgi:hypothetical protein
MADEYRGTVGTYRRAAQSYPPQFWGRWLYWTAFFAGQVGVWMVLLFDGRGWWLLDAVAVVLSIVGLVLAARRVWSGILMARSLWTICENLLGPVTKDGATVTVRPTGGPGAPGEVIVEYPDTPGVS